MSKSYDKLLAEANVLAVMSMQSSHYIDNEDFRDQVDKVYSLVNIGAYRKALTGMEQ